MKRVCSLLLCLVLVLSLFAGCKSGQSTESTQTEAVVTTTERPMTAEEVLFAAVERLKAAKSLAANLEMTAHFDRKLDREQDSFSLRISLPAELTLEPVACHGAGSTTITEDGSSENAGFEVYLFVENGKLVLYGKGQEDKRFERIETELPAVDQSLIVDHLSSVAWEMTEQGDSFVLSHTVSAEESRQKMDRALANIGEALAPISDELEETALLDGLRDLLKDARFTLTVDRESMELRELTAELSEGINAFLQSLFTEMAPEDRESAASIDCSLNCTLQLHGYDSVAPITAPTDYEDLGALQDMIPGFGSSMDGPFANAPEQLDDSYSLEGWSFRLSETTLRAFTDRGWVIRDDIQAFPEDAVPGQDRSIPGGTEVLLYLYREAADAERAPLWLMAVNTGETAADYLDCPICGISINEDPDYELLKEGALDFTGPEGIARSMSREEVEERLGKPENGMYDETRSASYYLSSHGEMLCLLFDEAGLLGGLFYQNLSWYNEDPAVLD